MSIPARYTADEVRSAILTTAPDTATAYKVADAVLGELERRPDAPIVRLAPGDAVILLDALGAAAILSGPAGDLGFLLDLGGRVNRPPSGDHAGPPERAAVRFLLAPGQAAELVVELLNAARAGGDPVRSALLDALKEL